MDLKKKNLRNKAKEYRSWFYEKILFFLRRRLVKASPSCFPLISFPASPLRRLIRVSGLPLFLLLLSMRIMT